MSRHSLIVCCLLLAGAAANADSGTRYYFGADLSYVNELEDCGAAYSLHGEKRDPFELLHEQGANLARVRLWNDARWTRYSNLADVKKTIQRSQRAGMEVLLDFHYSDDWADGEKQLIPAAWAHIEDVDALAQKVYEFTFQTLQSLNAAGLMPELVQVGNETNGEILSTLEKAGNSINWERNAKLLNAGIRAVREAGAKASVNPRVMLHIAQPENVEPWFAAATAAGVTDFDLIGISYYRRWSSELPQELVAVIDRLRHRYDADVLVVEAAYPWTLEAKDSMSDLLGTSTLVEGYPATRDGQRLYLIDLTQQIIEHGGVGLVYWEPAWISTSCKTRWGTGSAWENAALFDFGGNLLPGADFFKHPYAYPVEVELRVDDAIFEGKDIVYLSGDFLGEIVKSISRESSDRSIVTRLMPGRQIRFQLFADENRTKPLLKDSHGNRTQVIATVGRERTVIELGSHLR